MKQSPGYHSFAGPAVVGSPSLAGELPARSPDPGTGRAGASAPCSPSVDVVSSPRFGRGVAGAVPSSAGRAGASSPPDALCLSADGVLISTHLGRPDPARPLDHEASRAGAGLPSPASLFREMPEAAWRRIEAFTARAPEKPAFGSPCNGCGFCCAAEPCGVARQFVPGATDGAPCPAMEFEHGRFWCGMVRRPGYYLGLPAWGDEEMGAMIGEALGTGKGCCADVG